MGVDEMIPAVFLDRDGVLNHNVYYQDTDAYESPRTAEDMVLHARVLEALQLLMNAGFRLFLISNQPNAAKAKSTVQQLHQIHHKMEKILSEGGIRFEECYYCFHHPHGSVRPFSGPCVCRKPSTYFLYKAVRSHRISLPISWLIGDRSSDISCGTAAGVRTVQILPDHPQEKPHAELPAPTYTASNLWDAAQMILRAPQIRQTA